MATILQISDCHLFADPTAEIRGVRTRDTFLRVWEHATRSFPQADRLVISGDLTHDERIETYRELHSLLTDWIPRLLVIPGNHDDRSLLREVFSCRGVAGWERIVFIEDIQGWRLIGLDSHVPGELRGELGDEQLEWLDGVLREETSTPTVLFIHHPPISIHCEWLDRIGLQDAERLRQVLSRHSQIRSICTGHVHQDFTGQLGEIPVLTAPSTGLQFRPGTATLEIDAVPPGYRILRLEDDGKWSTEIVRVPEPT
jgi:Icc protein